MTPTSSTVSRSPLRIAILGAGFIAEFHARALGTVPGTILTAVVDPAIDRAGAFARRWSIPGVYASTESLYENEAVDVVHVLVPPPLHLPAVLACIKYGANVFLEKPAILSTAEAASLADACVDRSTVVGVNHNALFHP